MKTKTHKNDPPDFLKNPRDTIKTIIIYIETKPKIQKKLEKIERLPLSTAEESWTWRAFSNSVDPKGHLEMMWFTSTCQKRNTQKCWYMFFQKKQNIVWCKKWWWMYCKYDGVIYLWLMASCGFCCPYGKHQNQWEIFIALAFKCTPSKPGKSPKRLIGHCRSRVNLISKGRCLLTYDVR